MSIVLAIDTSAKPVSCALAQEDRVLGCFYANTGLTHSQTLMPMIEQLLRVSNITTEQLDAIAVNAGPGSFTGVRIGVSAVKGLAFTRDLPCVSVSTLESMASQVACNAESVICTAMDARCQQIYTALFRKNENGELIRLTSDQAMTLAELGNLLTKQYHDTPIIVVGDGSDLCYKSLKESVPNLSLAPASIRYQNAASTALIGVEKLKRGETVSEEEILPEYLRLPQAERELNSRLSLKK